MDDSDSKAGPSDIKKRKLMCRDSKKPTDDEPLQFFEESSDDEEYFSDDGDHFEFDDESSSDETSSDGEDYKDDKAGSITGIASTIPNWSEVPTPMLDIPFCRTNKLLQAIPGSEPIDYFRVICDDQILSQIVDETNTYAEEVYQSQDAFENSRISSWKNVTFQEMLKFLGLVLHTGTIRLHRFQDYWKGHPLFNLKCFSQHMSRDRFLLIMMCLNFNRNTPGQAANDRLYKIRPIIDFFNTKMSALYYPGKNISLDEPMVLWRGRLVFRQYIKNIRHKYGIKLFMLTEPDGTILKTLVYTEALDHIGGKGQTTKVVLELLENYLDAGHSVYLDDFYNSFDLANQLTKRMTYCTGTLNSKRMNNPTKFLSKKLKKGETSAVYSHNVLVGKWKDKRSVLYISNEHENKMVEFVDEKHCTKEQPKPIFHYNKQIGGVDHQDQMNEYYPCDRKTLRWYKKVGIHFIQLMLLNAFFLFKKYSDKTMSLYDFRLAVISKLLNVEVTNTKAVQSNDPTSHKLTKITSKNKKGETNRKRCRVCSQKNIRKMTLYHCERCPGQAADCVGDCFDVAHNIFV